MEKFNPNNPEYKSTSDLPPEQSQNYVDLPDGGFIDKSAWDSEQHRSQDAKQRNKSRPLLKKAFLQDKISPVDIAHEQALEEDTRLTRQGDKQQKPEALLPKKVPEKTIEGQQEKLDS